MADEIKPCPFCGSEAQWRDEGLYRWLYCSKEGCYAYKRRYVGSAVHQWNSRVEAAAVSVPSAEVRGALWDALNYFVQMHIAIATQFGKEMNTEWFAKTHAALTWLASLDKD